MGSGLSGLAIATAAVAATGVLDPGTLRAAADLASNGALIGLLGLGLIAFAATRHALREI